MSRKSFRERNYVRQRDKEYSKKHREVKRKRLEKPNNYPRVQRILIRDFFRTPDLYKGLLLFLAAQISVISITAGIKYENIAGAMNLFAILVGIIAVVYSIKQINKRQAIDKTRRHFRLSRVLKIVLVLLAAIVAVSFAFDKLGIVPQSQPNQVSLDELMTLFPLAMIFTIVIVSPIVEEFVFRELLPFATGPSIMSFISFSIVFILLHAPYGIAGWTSYGILSAGFLYARLKDNNIYTAIAVHMVWNALTIIM